MKPIIALMMLCVGVLTAQESELEALKKRVAALEENRLARGVEAALQKVTLSGAIEIEGSYARTKGDSASENEESDLVLATFELGVEVVLTPWLRGSAVLLWEEDEGPVELDSASVYMGNEEKCPGYLELGKIYVPFGNFESSFITDPVALELGEASETALRIGALWNGFDTSISIFHGDVNEAGTGNDHIENYVAALSYSIEWESGSLSLGAAYINNLADSDNLQDAVSDNASGGEIDDFVGGANAWITAACGPVTIVLEYLTATEAFAPNTLSFDGAGNDWTTAQRPETLNTELAYALNEKFSVAARFEKTHDAVGWMPEERYGFVLGCTLHQSNLGSTSLALEYLHGEYDDGDNTNEDTVTLQLAFAF